MYIHLTQEVKNLTKARNAYHILLLENLVTPGEYARFRNKITSLIRKCKEKYYERCFLRVSGNIKSAWKMIRRLNKGYQNDSISEININGISITNPSVIAKSFNEYFVNIANDLANELPPSDKCPYEYVAPNTMRTFELYPVSLDECASAISLLRITKQDSDHISVEMFKKFSSFFSHIICDLVNKSFTSGIFPNCFKHSTVKPLLKKGDSTIISNYRPITILPFISKIFEHCLCTRLVNFAAMCNILSPNQFGFTKGKSTQDAIIMLTERIYECFNETDGSFCLNVFVDFKKCFDTIDHVILLRKLELYGITGTALNFISNYLSNRTQSVRTGNCTSPPLSITKGIFQGSKTGPLLFLYFINDLTNISRNFVPVLFADDTTISFKCSSISEANILCNNELQKFFDWTAANKMSINFGRDKTYFILHTYRNLNASDLNIQINNNNLENLDEAPFLGVVIDSKLKFSPHIEYVARKISKSIGIIFNLKNLKMPFKVLKQVYYSLVYSYLNYNACSYLSAYDTHLERLILLQKRVIRIMNGARFLAHTDPIFYSNGILKIHDIYKLNVGLYIYDQLSSGRYAREHGHYTRNRNDLRSVQARLTMCQHSISVAGPNIFNSLPSNIREAPSRDSFKIRCKNYLLSFYQNDET